MPPPGLLLPGGAPGAGRPELVRRTEGGGGGVSGPRAPLPTSRPRGPLRLSSRPPPARAAGSRALSAVVATRSRCPRPPIGMLLTSACTPRAGPSEGDPRKPRRSAPAGRPAPGGRPPSPGGSARPAGGRAGGETGAGACARETRAGTGAQPGAPPEKFGVGGPAPPPGAPRGSPAVRRGPPAAPRTLRQSPRVPATPSLLSLPGRDRRGQADSPWSGTGQRVGGNRCASGDTDEGFPESRKKKEGGRSGVMETKGRFRRGRGVGPRAPTARGRGVRARRCSPDLGAGRPRPAGGARPRGGGPGAEGEVCAGSGPRAWFPDSNPPKGLCHRDPAPARPPQVCVSVLGGQDLSCLCLSAGKAKHFPDSRGRRGRQDCEPQRAPGN